MKTVLITGSSSGYGLETARRFLSEGWRVIATMRTPRADVLPASDRLRVIALDVTKAESIAAAIEAAGPIDALVNNAGVGGMGALEGASMGRARAIFETNVFGTMAMTQSVIPQMRVRRAGVIVNISSSSVLTPMPLVSVYAASKHAVEGFTASLAHELGAFDVRVKLVQPGYGPSTRFAENTDVRMEEAIPPAYQAFAQPVLAAFAQTGLVTVPADVADGVWRAVNDETGQLRFPAGPDAVALARSA